jgi:hypothetical protein
MNSPNWVPLADPVIESEIGFRLIWEPTNERTYLATTRQAAIMGRTY